MKRGKIKAALVAAAFTVMAGSVIAAEKVPTVKTRLEHFTGTDYVLIISYVPAEITSITCEGWTMLGVKSWNDQNNFTLPAATPLSGAMMPTVAVMNSHKFNGYCAKPGSLVAHTDDGDFVGYLDRGDGNWKDSTKLTIPNK